MPAPMRSSTRSAWRIGTLRSRAAVITALAIGCSECRFLVLRLLHHFDDLVIGRFGLSANYLDDYRVADVNGAAPDLVARHLVNQVGLASERRLVGDSGRAH